MAMEFEIDAYRKGRELFIILRGRLVLNYCHDTKTRLSTLFGTQIDQVYLYLAELSFLDSAGLGVLVGLKMVSNKNRTRFTLLAPPSRIEDIFRVSKLDTIFEIRGGSEADAIRSAILQDEFCLWRDSKDSRQGTRNTESHSPSPSRTNWTPPLSVTGAGNDETNQKTRQLCADAVEYIRQGDFPKAVDAYTCALNLDPDNLSALNNLGIVYEKRAEWYGLAMEIWKKVLELSAGQQDEKHAGRARKHLESLSKLMKVQ